MSLHIILLWWSVTFLSCMVLADMDAIVALAHVIAWLGPVVVGWLVWKFCR